MTTDIYGILYSGLTFESNLDYLLPHLRLHLGDYNPTSYRYLNEWLRLALAESVKSLQPWWKDKYRLDDDYNIIRNSDTTRFVYDEPPTVQQQDVRPIVLMASILVKEGSLEESAWSAGYWKDAEISYSNIENTRTRDKSVQRDWDELNGYLLPPARKLAGTRKNSLPGYHRNRIENADI